MSQDLRSFSSSLGKSRHHLSFIPKYRHEIFGYERIKIVCEHSFHETARKYGFIIRELGFDTDHLHMVVDTPPSYSLSRVVKLFKGRSSRKLFKTFPWLKKNDPKDRKRFWGGHFWSPSYFFDSIGDVQSEIIENYVRKQGEKGDQKRLNEYFAS